MVERIEKITLYTIWVNAGGSTKKEQTAECLMRGDLQQHLVARLLRTHCHH